MRYSIYRKKSSDEHHLYEAEGYSWNCKPTETSVCKKATTTGSIGVSSCLIAAEARHKAAEIGETFCGTCVSHLYRKY
jgi:hypothetical protein